MKREYRIPAGEAGIVTLPEMDAVPMVLYHGTFAHRLPGIMANGLGAMAFRNYDISRSGVVYLSDDADTADQYASESQFHSGDVVVIEIDVSQLDTSLLQSDRNDEGEFGSRSWEYHGVVPVSAIALLGHYDISSSSP